MKIEGTIIPNPDSNRDDVEHSAEFVEQDNAPEAVITIGKREHGECGEQVLRFLNHIHAEKILADERERSEYLQNLSFEDFSNLIVRLNGLVRDISPGKRKFDGETVLLTEDPDRLSSRLLGTKVSYPPRYEDKQGLLREAYFAMQSMLSDTADMHDVGLAVSTAINAIHFFNDGNGRVSRLVHALIAEGYDGSLDQGKFFEKILGDNGRLFIDNNPEFAERAIEDYILSEEISARFSEKLHFSSWFDDQREAERALEEKIAVEPYADFKKYIFDSFSLDGYFATLQYLIDTERTGDFLYMKKRGGEDIVCCSAHTLIEQLHPEEIKELLDEFWRLKRHKVSLLIHALAYPEEYTMQSSSDEEGVTIKKLFLSEQDSAERKSFEEVNVQDIGRIWSERVTLPYANIHFAQESMREIHEIRQKLNEFADAAAMERAALDFDLSAAMAEVGRLESVLKENYIEWVGDSPEKAAYEAEKENKKKEFYAAKRKILAPVYAVEEKYLAQVVSYLDGLSIWGEKFTTRNNDQYLATEAELSDTESIYYVTKTGQSLRLRKHDLATKGLSKCIQPFAEKVFFGKEREKNFEESPIVGERVFEYFTESFLAAQDDKEVESFTSEIREYDINGQPVYMNPVDGRVHRGYEVYAIFPLEQ